MLRCKECFVPVIETNHGRCEECYREALEAYGELGLAVEHLSKPGPEHYEFDNPDTVYAYFYRLEELDPLFIVKVEERRWCLKIRYASGYPCPPRLAFVNAYNHKDDNPIWWPKTKFKLDPVKQLFDIPHVDTKTAMYLPVPNEIPLHQWAPDHYISVIAPSIIPFQEE